MTQAVSEFENLDEAGLAAVGVPRQNILAMKAARRIEKQGAVKGDLIPVRAGQYAIAIFAALKAKKENSHA